jgi:endonuclease/exonuclease/phosphatase family metal-dependent hydrolase
MGDHRALRQLSAAVSALLLLASSAFAQHNVRVAQYNIQFLSTDVQNQGNRLDKLRQVITLLDADVIGLEEIADRAALKLVFPPDKWDILIDDDSTDVQDLAIVARHPFKIIGVNVNLNADDVNFLFPGPQNDTLFPNRRDMLFAEIQIPDSSGTFFVIVDHAKSRLGGRAVTDPRREGAAGAIVQMFEQRFDEKDFVLLGDFNDNPDDRSMNILETGNPATPGGAEGDGPFLMNLMDALVAGDHVSWGRDALDIVGDHINTIDPGSRQRNNVNRGNDVNTGEILFDQVLIPMRMKDRYVAASARVFDRAVAIEGSAQTRASDHLPVFADFVLGGPPIDPPAGIRIASLLPDPIGEDKGHEQITIANGTSAALNLTGWLLRDRGQNEFKLTGTVAANGNLTITMTVFTMPLNNSGDEVFLIDPQGNIRHKVRYEGSQVQPGVVIAFPQ